MKERIVSILRNRAGVLVMAVVVTAGLVGGGVVLAQNGDDGGDDAVAEISATRADDPDASSYSSYNREEDEGYYGYNREQDEDYYYLDVGGEDYDERWIPDELRHFAPASGDEVADNVSPGLARAVAAGAVTQSEADELLEWLRNAPSVVFTVWQHFEALTVNEQTGVFPSYSVGDPDYLTAQSYQASVWANLVQAGLLTATEVLAVTEWIADAPALVSDQLGGALGGVSFATSHGGGFVSSPPGLEEYFLPASGSEIANALAPGLSRAVVAGVISQSEAEELLEWLRSSPDAVFTLPERLGELTLNELDTIFFDPLSEPVVAFNDPDQDAPVVEDPDSHSDEFSDLFGEGYVSSILDGLVRAEILTGEEASAILEWLKRAPAVVNEGLLGGFAYGASSGLGITSPLVLVDPDHDGDYSAGNSGGFEDQHGTGSREE